MLRDSGANVFYADGDVHTIVSNQDNVIINYDSNNGGAGTFALQSGGADVMTFDNAGNGTIINSLTTNGINNGGDGITNAGAVSGVTTLTATTGNITTVNSGALTNVASVVISADNDGLQPGAESVALSASGVTALTATSTTTTIYGNLNMDNGAISNATTIGASGLITGAGGLTLDNFTVADGTGNTAIGGTLGVTGATTLSGATQINNTLGVTGLITGTGGAVISSTGANGDEGIANSGFIVGEFQGRQSILGYTGDLGTGNSGLLLVSGNASALVDQEDLNEEDSITHNLIGVGDLGSGVRGATVLSINEENSLTYGLQATDGVVTVGVGDTDDGTLLHGLTVDNTKTILTGGTSVSGAEPNSSSLVLEDAAATLSVGTADTDEIQVLQATNNGMNTSVAIGGNYNVLNNIQATAENGVNNITANATSGTNNIEAHTNNIGVATANSINNIGNGDWSSVNTIKGTTRISNIGTNGAGGQAQSVIDVADDGTGQSIQAYTVDGATGNGGMLNISGNSSLLADVQLQDNAAVMRNIVAVGDILGTGTHQTLVASVNESSTVAYGLNAIDGRVTVGVTDFDGEAFTFNHGLAVDDTKSRLTGGAGVLATNGTIGTTSSAGAGAITTYGTAQTIPAGTTINNHLDGKQYQNEVNGNLFVDGNVYINGTLDYVSSDSASTTVFGEEGTSVLPGATQGTSGGTTIVMKGTDGANESMAAITLTNGYGNNHGLKIYEDRTVLSGGAYSTTMTLRDSGAYFQNTLTGGPAKVTGVADGVDDYDAVNYRQLRKANVGIASVSAMAAIPGTMPGKRFAIGAGYGHFEGENALAIGLKASIWDRVNVTGAVGLGVGQGDSSTTYSASAGVSYSF